MEIVSALQNAVAGKVGQEVFDLWFGNQVRLRYNAGTLTVLAPNSFMLDRLKHRLRCEIEAACSAVIGVVPPMEFSVEAAPETAAPVVAMVTAPGAADNHQISIPVRPAFAARRRLASLADFVVGDSNRIAHSAACAGMSRPGMVSPLFIYGPTGCGKTHL